MDRSEMWLLQDTERMHHITEDFKWRGGLNTNYSQIYRLVDAADFHLYGLAAFVFPRYPIFSEHL